MTQEPWYQPIGDECTLFEAAYARRLPVLLKGPTGCGKTRFVEHMARRLGRPLVTIACHDDLSASDLTGRWLLDAGGTRWLDGPLTTAVRTGAICYLDELVEARSDTTVVIHPLADSRRVLPLDKCNQLVHAHPDFALVVSYNPGYASHHKVLKPSTLQRFCGIEFGPPEAEIEARIVAHESGIDPALAVRLVALGARTRRLQGQGLDEGASTRMLVHAGVLMQQGVAAQAACRMALVTPLTDDPDLAQALRAAVDATF
ncbi:MAG: CbbQ/NirQ/NorQ/GpvN family protein [Rhizobacter sp.]|nr:CbbQ/NirQ/NorQ/GpvN family protein [Rhizobacter sp.]MBP6270441.1 CbbQ/NirQ/NorQ/GpvN family protein [Rhizobacter sp.]